MGTYLENYLESVSELPSEVRRNFALMRELDTHSQSINFFFLKKKSFFIHILPYLKKTITQLELLDDISKQQQEYIEKKKGEMYLYFRGFISFFFVFFLFF